MLELIWAPAIAVTVLYVGLWLWSLARGDVTVGDPFWGLGFVVLMVPVAWRSGPPDPVGAVAAVLLAIWAVRYAAYVWRRPWGHREDDLYYPYRTWRERGGRSYWWISLFRVFLPQVAGHVVVGSPVLVAMADRSGRDFGLLELMGTAVVLAGMTIEATADRQLVRFKGDPANAGGVLDRGLWRYSRHPNYFGDALMWWGFFLLAYRAPGGPWTAASPVLMTVLLAFGTGVVLNERSSRVGRTAAYAAYVARTSAFVPWPPRRSEPP